MWCFPEDSSVFLFMGACGDVYTVLNEILRILIFAIFASDPQK